MFQAMRSELRQLRGPLKPLMVLFLIFLGKSSPKKRVLLVSIGHKMMCLGR